MENPPSRWLAAATSRITRALKRRPADFPLITDDPETFLGEGFQWLHQVGGDPVTCDVVREHYGRRHDGQHIEFLLACSSFGHARGPLQRFEQYRHIICKFVHPGAARPVQLSDARRGELLREWERWCGGNRLPVGVELPALQAAQLEIQQVVEQERAAA
ncbi:hypothetical protein [Ramlibacter albus]|uniref:Uncharacterized protein n=1 Tax=Ramlibacter albus TaxID=2079448 RepID=A0A923S3B7_9BURK|nr:hypothetical protein [Ramlibacter albus]MBC5766251.1 hypothetical protein [Ramlibacter albus]